jgi:hypothetical protein
MLANGTYFPGVTDPHYDRDLTKIPDISVTGKDFYTWTYRRDITRDLEALALAHISQDNTDNSNDNGNDNGNDARTAFVSSSYDPRVWLHLRGICYFATVFVNGKAMTPVQSPGVTRLQGMFHRWSFDLGLLPALSRSNSAGSSVVVAVRVEPPEFPGAACKPCSDPPCVPCGQGGDHQIARNAAMMQFTQGYVRPIFHSS